MNTFFYLFALFLFLFLITALGIVVVHDFQIGHWYFGVLRIVAVGAILGSICLSSANQMAKEAEEENIIKNRYER